MKSHITSIDVLRRGVSTAAVRAYWPSGDLAKAQGAGFGVLRPIWDLDKAMNADGTINHTYLDGVLDACIRWLGLHSLTEVVLCPFNGPNSAGFSAWQEAISGNPARAVKFFKNLAAWVGSKMDISRVWFELMNEPSISGDAWKKVQQQLYAAVRSKLPSCGVVLGFGGVSGLSDLMNYGTLDYSGPGKRRWGFHQYAPYWILRGLGNAPGAIYGLDYDWPMSVEALKSRFLSLQKDQGLIDKLRFIAEVESGAKALPVGQTLDGLEADLFSYADNMIRYDAWGMGVDPLTGQGREWTMTGNHDAVPFTYEGMLRTLQVARDWELATGETLMMTEGGGGGWAYGSQTPDARRTILRLQADEARVYKALGWQQHGWWMLNSLFTEDAPGVRQIDAELLASIVDGVAA